MTEQIDLLDLYDRTVDRLQSEGHKDAHAQAADTILLVVELEEKIDEVK